MLGSTPVRLLPAEAGRAIERSGGVPRSAPTAAASASGEPAAQPPLLRGAGVGLAEAVDPDAGGPPHDAVEPPAAIAAILAQLAPIRTREALLDSFAREANPHDALVRAAYASAWASLVVGTARNAIRRDRGRVALAVGPNRRTGSGRVRGRG